MTSLLRTSILAVVLLALAALNAYVAVEPVSREPLPAAGSWDATGLEAVADFRRGNDVPEADAQSDVIMRPLFWRGRRPASPIKSSTAAQTDTPAIVHPASLHAVRLTGVMLDGAKIRQALLVWPQHPDGRWLAEGAEIDGWRLTRIERSIVRLEAGGQTRQLELH